MLIKIEYGVVANLKSAPAMIDVFFIINVKVLYHFLPQIMLEMKQRLHNMEMEMSKLRSKQQVKIEKDGKPCPMSNPSKANLGLSVCVLCVWGRGSE